MRGEGLLVWWARFSKEGMAGMWFPCFCLFIFFIELGIHEVEVKGVVEEVMVVRNVVRNGSEMQGALASPLARERKARVTCG